MGRAIAFTSGKGGVGKTTVSAGIAEALARSGKKTLALDADFDLGNLDILLGMQESVYTLGDVLAGSCSLDDAIYECDGSENLFYLSAAMKRERSESLEASHVRSLLDRLCAVYDFIIIDTAAGIGPSFSLFGIESDAVMLITAPHAAALRDAQRVVSLLQQADKLQAARLVVNMVDCRLIEKEKAPDIDAIINLTGTKLIGLIPFEKKLTGWQNAGKSPLSSRPPAVGAQLTDMAKRLCGKQVPLRRFW